MEISIKKSFEYIKNDPKIVKKVVIAALFSAISVAFGIFDIVSQLQKVELGAIYYLIEVIYSLFFACLMCGYYSSVINQKLIQPESNLPEWDNIKRITLRGVKLYIPIIITTLALGIIFVPMIIGAGAYLAISSMQAGGVNFVAVLLFSAIVTLYILFVSIVALAQSMAFSTNLKFKSAFDFALIKKIIFKDFKFFINYNIKVFLVSLVWYLLLILCSITIIGVLLIPVLGFIYTVIVADLSAQYIKELFAVNR